MKGKDQVWERVAPGKQKSFGGGGGEDGDGEEEKEKSWRGRRSASEEGAKERENP